MMLELKSLILHLRASTRARPEALRPAIAVGGRVRGGECGDGGGLAMAVQTSALFGGDGDEGVEAA